MLEGHTDAVTSVAFSPDGQRIFAWDTQKNVLAWSAADGKPIDPVNPPPAPPPGPARSPDGFLNAVPQGNTVAITDKRPSPRDNAWPLPDPDERKRYHTEQADLAEQKNHWFAAGYHLHRVLRDDPDNASVKTRLPRIPCKIAYDQKKFALATRLWAEALASDPELDEEPWTQPHYTAARAAAMAATGRGTDEPTLDDSAKAKLRRQALDWLNSQLRTWHKLLESSQPEARLNIVRALIQWQQASDLAGIRDAEALDRMPPGERGAGRTNCGSNVGSLLKKAEAPSE